MSIGDPSLSLVGSTASDAEDAEGFPSPKHLALFDCCFPKSPTNTLNLRIFSGKDQVCESFDYYDSIDKAEGRISRIRLWIYTVIAGIVLGFTKGGVTWAIDGLQSSRLAQMSDLARSTGDIYASTGVMIAYAIVFALISAALVIVVAPPAGGGGISDIKAYLNGYLLSQFLSKRTLFVRVIGVSLVVSTGVLAGPEGPMAHVGMIINVLVPSLLHPSVLTDRQIFDFATVGAGMGIAAAFTAPLSGTLFALEEAASLWHPELTSRTFLGSVVASVLGEYVSSGFQCDPSSSFCVPIWGEFAFTDTSLVASSFEPWELPLFILVGIGSAVLATVLSYLMIFFAKFRAEKINTSTANQLAFSVFIFLISAATLCLLTPIASCYPIRDLPVSPEIESLQFASSVCPSGKYNPIALLLLEPRTYSLRTLFSASPIMDPSISQLVLWIALVPSLFLLSLTVGLPLPAGMFIPAVFCGALFGRSIGELVYQISNNDLSIFPGIYAVAGAAGFLAGVSRMTIWIAAVMIEGTSDVFVTIPIVLSVIASKLTADYLMPYALYDRQIIASRVHFLPPIDDQDVDKRFDGKCIGDIMTSPAVAVFADADLPNTRLSAHAALSLTNVVLFPLVSREGNVCGLINRDEVLLQLSGEEWIGSDRVPVVVLPSIGLRKAYYLFTQLGLHMLVVADERNVLQGVVTRTNSPLSSPPTPPVAAALSGDELAFLGSFFPSPPTEVEIAAAKTLPQASVGTFDYFDSVDPTDRPHPRIPRWRLWMYTLITACVIGLTRGAVAWATSSLTSVRLSAMSDVANSHHNKVWAAMGVMAAYAVLVSITASLGVVFVSRAAGGGGIADIKAFLNGNSLNLFLAKRTLCVRLACVAFIVSSGVMAGFEGSMAHIGTILGALIPKSLHRSSSRLTDRQLFDFATVGAGMGIAAAFATPIAGTLFALEEASSLWHPALIGRTFVGAVTASIVAQYTSAGFVCDPASAYCVPVSGEFGFTTTSLLTSSFQPWELPLFLLTGAAAGVLATAVSYALLFFARNRSQRFAKCKPKQIAESVVVFLVTAVLFCSITAVVACAPTSVLPEDSEGQSLKFANSVCETVGMFNPIAAILLEPRQFAVRTLFSGSTAMDTTAFTQPVLWLSLAVAAAMLSVTMGLPIPGGMFIQSVFCGAIFGRSIGQAVAAWTGVASVAPGIYAVAGAAGFLAGVSRMTIWISVVLIEATSDVFLTIPIVLAVIAGNVAASVFMKTAFYEQQMLAKRINFLPPIDDVDVDKRLGGMRVRDVMTSPVVVVNTTTTWEVVNAVLKISKITLFPILSANGHVVGLIGRNSLQTLVLSKPTTTGDSAEEGPLTVEPTRVAVRVPRSASLTRAHYLFRQLGLHALVVTDNHNVLQGIITRTDLTKVLHSSSAQSASTSALISGL